MTVDSPPMHLNTESAGSLNKLMGGATLLLWVYLFLPELKGFIHLLGILEPFNLALLAGATVVLLVQGIRSREQWRFSLESTFRGWPLVMLLGVAIASLLARTFLDLEHLSIVGVVIGAYGLIGLFCDARIWKRSLPFMGLFAMLMLLFALEFTDLGHLARTSIAEVVELMLKPLHVDAISSEDVLVLSTGVAFVDVPCSGFKNIEIGSLFFIVASLLARKQMGLKWLLVGFTTVALLIAANITRILVIVILTFVLQQQTLAEILHVPLGLCGFITVCCLTLFLLRWVPRQQPFVKEQERTRTPNLRNAVLTLGLLFGLTFVPHPVATAPATLSDLQLPISTQAIDLTPTEQAFFTRYPGVVAQKQAFDLEGISGSMIFVASPTWQAHHAPELCFTGSGFKIDRMERRALTENVTGRWLSLNQGQQQAAYWFQSQEHTTDHYLDRVWREITRRDSQWTMVSILFDQPVSAESAELKTMVAGVQGAIADAMS